MHSLGVYLGVHYTGSLRGPLRGLLMDLLIGPLKGPLRGLLEESLEGPLGVLVIVWCFLARGGQSVGPYVYIYEQRCICAYKNCIKSIWSRQQRTKVGLSALISMYYEYMESFRIRSNKCNSQAA